MAAALPLSGLPAWRVYLGLPLSGSRLPAGGLEAFFQLGYQDAVLKVFEPTCRQAVEEFPAALAALRQALLVVRALDDQAGIRARRLGAGACWRPGPPACCSRRQDHQQRARPPQRSSASSASPHPGATPRP
jgi:hypothetical protein